MNRFEKHVRKILQEMQSSKEEREELGEELLTHLYSMKAEFIEQGDSEKRAERRALEEFGGAKLVGNGLQETMYPMQRGLLYLIGIGTILFGFFLHLVYITQVSEPSKDWLLVQFAFGTTVTLVAMNISWLGRYYWSVNVLIYLTACWNGFNYFVVIQFPTSQSIPLIIYIISIILISFIFMVRNAYYSTARIDQAEKKKKVKLASHGINLMFGLVLSTAALFATWAGLAFGEINWRILSPLGSIVGWLLFYKYQMKFISKRPIVAMFTGLIFIVLIAATPITIPLLF